MGDMTFRIGLGIVCTLGILLVINTLIGPLEPDQPVSSPYNSHVTVTQGFPFLVEGAVIVRDPRSVLLEEFGVQGTSVLFLNEEPVEIKKLADLLPYLQIQKVHFHPEAPEQLFNLLLQLEIEELEDFHRPMIFGDFPGSFTWDGKVIQMDAKITRMSPTEVRIEKTMQKSSTDNENIFKKVVLEIDDEQLTLKIRELEDEPIKFK